MLPRISRLSIGTARRAYSFFSSKPGGGRYFNSSKPHKVATATSPSGKATAKPDDGSSSPASSSSSPGPEDATMKPANEADAPLPVSEPVARPAVPPLPPHPTFSSHTYPLHQFFSLHRPLLLLPLATSTLFETSCASFDEATHPSRDTAVPQLEEHAESSADADADAARQLSRALALNRVGGWIDWEETLARLGDTERYCASPTCRLHNNVEANVLMDSTKRKRRKKMSKHKYKKRRRLQRAARQKMGK